MNVGSYLLLAAMLSTLISVSPVNDPSQPSRSTRELTVAVPIADTLSGGQQHRYQVELTPGTWLVSVEQQGVDVVVEVSTGDSRVLAVDSPVDRAGPESLLVRSQAAGSYQIEVRARTPKEPSGEYEIRILQISDPLQLAAEQAMTEAGELYLHDNAEARRSTVAAYQRALSLWRELGDSRQEARTLFCIAGLYRLLDEYDQAQAAYHEVLPLCESLGNRGKQASVLNSLGLIVWRQGKLTQADEYFEQALAIWQDLGDRPSTASALSNTCLIDCMQDRLEEALLCFDEVLALAPGRAATHTNVGRIYDVLGEPEPAFEHYHLALEAARAISDRQNEASILNNLGALHRRLGGLQEALRFYGQALTIYNELGNRRGQAITLNNLGRIFHLLGDQVRARSYLEQALPLQRAVGDHLGETATLGNLGLVYSELGLRAEAVEHLGQAVKLRREAGNQRRLGTSLSLMGTVLAGSGDLSRGYELLTEALELTEAAGDQRRLVHVLVFLGQLHLLQADPEPAKERLQQALALARTIKDRHGEELALFRLAQAEQALGNLGPARSLAEQAIASIESVPSLVTTPELRAASLSSKRQVYQQLIELLMTAHAADPSAGLDRAALEISERARARTMLELLQESGVVAQEGIDSELQQRRTVALQRLNAKVARRLKLLSARFTEGEAQAVEQEVYQALSDLAAVDQEIHRRSPRLAALTSPRSLTCEEIQGLLDDDTVLLEYALGESRSFLWAVTKGSVQVHELPRQKEIEVAVRRVHEQLSALDPDAWRSEDEAVKRLAQMLLGPVDEQLQGKRAAVVADGVLHLLPFSALPGSASAGLPAREAVFLPSASALALLRQEQQARPLAPNLIAAVADPVFSRDDTRVAADSTRSETGSAAEAVLRSLRYSELTDLQRLPYTRREAEAIRELVPASNRMLLVLGFQASRATVLGDTLRRYRIVHFATHGLLDSRNPALSGLVLSLVSEDGRDLDGYLRLHDIYGLRLGAELVVLSGCQTALGQEIRGEGLVGITRGFMYAGVPQVVASLWRVPDRVTTALMTRFYEAMLVQGKSPTLALLEAQRSIRQRKEWRDPYFWSAFVLHGDWQSRLATADPASLVRE